MQKGQQYIQEFVEEVKDGGGDLGLVPLVPHVGEKTP
jgi:hypothetical protein